MINLPDWVVMPTGPNPQPEMFVGAKGGVAFLHFSLSQELYQFLHLRLPASIMWIALLADDYMSFSLSYVSLA